jgi:hypothetical protein
MKITQTANLEYCLLSTRRDSSQLLVLALCMGLGIVDEIERFSSIREEQRRERFDLSHGI